MINNTRYLDFLIQFGIEYFCGVPDSLLKDFLTYLYSEIPPEKQMITANEGLSIALATGYYLSTGKMPLVYLQNSGLGNIINPLTSLTDKEMYGIPMLLMIGWRGQPGKSDEVQHKKMGRITPAILETLGVNIFHISSDEKKSIEQTTHAIVYAQKHNTPVALLVEENSFEKEYSGYDPGSHTLLRNQVLDQLIRSLKGTETVVCSTGKIAREFYQLNKSHNNKIKKYFLSVGAMGHANHIALGISLASNEKVIMIDGDGSLLMHLGSIPAIAANTKAPFIHLLINNECHESVGGQPTAAFNAHFPEIAKACGFSHVYSIADENELEIWMNTKLSADITQFVEIKTNKTSLDHLGRPVGLPEDWKLLFMNAIKADLK